MANSNYAVTVRKGSKWNVYFTYAASEEQARKNVKPLVPGWRVVSVENYDELPAYQPLCSDR